MAIPALCRPIGRSGFAILLLTGLAGCGDEAAERNAFIDFLQGGIVSQRGFHLPKMTAEKAKAFGPYARHYQVILDYHQRLDAGEFAKLAPLQGLRDERLVVALATHRDDVKAAAESCPTMRAEWDRAAATADAAHRALQQPPDLKRVYGSAYDKTVTQLSAQAGGLLPLMCEQLVAMVALADFLNSKPNMNDPEREREANALLEALHKHDDGIEQARRRWQAFLQGT